MKSIFTFFLIIFSVGSTYATQSAIPDYTCRYTYSEPDGDEYTTSIEVYLSQESKYIIYRDSQLSEAIQAKINKMDSKSGHLILEGTLSSPTWQPGTDFVIRLGKKQQSMTFVLPRAKNTTDLMNCN
jgi:hypothetical protein